VKENEAFKKKLFRNILCVKMEIFRIKYNYYSAELAIQVQYLLREMWGGVLKDPFL
jgi:hypothetical protein